MDALFVRAVRLLFAAGWRQEIYLHTELTHRETKRSIGWREYLDTDGGYTRLLVGPVMAPEYGIPDSVQVTSVRQAVGVLVALDILPASVLDDRFATEANISEVVDRLRQAIWDPGSIVGRRLHPSWGEGSDGYAERPELLPDWNVRAVVAVLVEAGLLDQAANVVVRTRPRRQRRGAATEG